MNAKHWIAGMQSRRRIGWPGCKRICFFPTGFLLQSPSNCHRECQGGWVIYCLKGGEGVRMPYLTRAYVVLFTITFPSTPVTSEKVRVGIMQTSALPSLS